MRCESICYRLAAAAILLLLAGCASTPPGEGARLIDAALAGGHRLEANRARDVYRHPKETLQFFGLEPGMTVVEIWPGAGWYTEVLAPVLRGRGTLYAAHFHVDGKSPKYMGPSRDGFMKKLAAQPAVYDRVRVTTFGAPQHVAIAPAGSADMVLTFRNVHNWSAAKSDEAVFRAFYAALKPGGVLGVVEDAAADAQDHRAVALHQRSERGLVLVGDEAAQQRVVRQGRRPGERAELAQVQQGLVEGSFGHGVGSLERTSDILPG